MDLAVGGGGRGPRTATSSHKVSQTLPLVSDWLAAWSLGWQCWFLWGPSRKLGFPKQRQSFLSQVVVFWLEAVVVMNALLELWGLHARGQGEGGEKACELSQAC